MAFLVYLVAWITFLHAGDQMLVRHDITVHGPLHDVDMGLLVRVRYDKGGKVEASPSSRTTSGFDHVLNTLLWNRASA
jgi:hypothetical protein